MGRVARLREAFETLSPMARHYFPNWLGNKPGMMGDDTFIRHLVSYLRADTLKIHNHNSYVAPRLLDLHGETSVSGDRLFQTCPAANYLDDEFFNAIFIINRSKKGIRRAHPCENNFHMESFRGKLSFKSKPRENKFARLYLLRV